MFENIGSFFRKIVKPEQKELGSKDAAKERLHLVLMQDRANVSADFLELMKQEILDVIKKYIIIDESAIDVRLTNQSNEDGTNGAPALYANIPIVNIKNEMIVNKIKQFDGIDFNKDVEGTPEYDVKIINLEDEEKSNENSSNLEVNKNESNPTPVATEIKQPIEESSEECKNEKNGILDNIGEKIDELEDKIENKIDDIKEKIEEKIEEKIDRAINTDTFTDDYDDEDDDDVTFDDLLKAAEEEEKKNINDSLMNNENSDPKRENMNKRRKKKNRR